MYAEQYMVSSGRRNPQAVLIISYETFRLHSTILHRGTVGLVICDEVFYHHCNIINHYSYYFTQYFIWIFCSSDRFTTIFSVGCFCLWLPSSSSHNHCSRFLKCKILNKIINTKVYNFMWIIIFILSTLCILGACMR